jgi:hypothetical protein
MANRIIFTFNQETSDEIRAAGFTAGNGTFGLIQSNESANDTNFTLVRIDPYLPKEIFTDRTSNIMGASASSGYKWFIVDPNPATTYDLLTVDPPPGPVDGQEWNVSFGGDNMRTGSVCKQFIVNNTFTPNTTLFAPGWGTLKAGHSIKFVYDSYVAAWRCIAINKTDS